MTENSRRPFQMPPTCPEICPGSSQSANKPKQENRDEDKAHRVGPYWPGQIQPPTPPVLQSDGVPPWLPQATDAASGDFLTMTPIDPWAPGHMDWSPQAGTTGLRPVVDRYSLTRYSTGQWRKNNQRILDAKPVKLAKSDIENLQQLLKNTNEEIKQKEDNTNNMLDKKIQDLRYWKNKTEEAQKAIAEELEALEENRSRLKTTSRILMMPEAISRECLELRTHRLEPDQVRDDAEQELIREVALVGEIRRVFNETLAKVEKQIQEVRAAKAAIELNWSDKKETMKLAKFNRDMDWHSNITMKHPGVDRFTENSCALDYWLHYCAETIKNCEEVRIKSARLRGDTMWACKEGGMDLKKQFDRTNMALKTSIDAQEGLCQALEETLKNNLEKIVGSEELIDDLKAKVRELEQREKLAMTRLHAWNYERPNVENCRDEALYAILDETKFTKEKLDLLKNKIRETEFLRNGLIKYRGDLELQIAGKRKCLNIDRDRMSMIRAHCPTPEEFAPF